MTRKPRELPLPACPCGVRTVRHCEKAACDLAWCRGCKAYGTRDLRLWRLAEPVKPRPVAGDGRQG